METADVVSCAFSEGLGVLVVAGASTSITLLLGLLLSESLGWLVEDSFVGGAWTTMTSLLSGLMFADEQESFVMVVVGGKTSTSMTAVLGLVI